MGKTFYLALLILCVFLAQGIASLLKGNIEESSNLHIRKKRLIDLTRYGNRPMSIHYAAYTVNILKAGVSRCAGSILSNIMVITAASCFYQRNVNYHILSDSSSRHNGTRHDIKRIVKHPQFNPITLANNIALVRVSPPFHLAPGHNHKVELPNSIYIRPGTPVIMSGWGCIRATPRQIFPEELRIVRIPLMSRQLCQQYYRQTAIIGEENICALDKTGRIGSCYGDEGNPLVLNFELLGVLSYRKGILSGHNPEVFTDIRNLEIKRWISSTMQNGTMWASFPRHYRKSHV